MSGDFSRITFDPSKQYDQVLMQQGRVQIDADWNEAQEIAAAQNAAQVVDVIGPLGAKGDGFRIHLLGGASSIDFMIQPGRCYVEGVVAELLAPTPARCTVTDANHVTVASTVVDDLPFATGQMIELIDATGSVVSQNGTPIRFQVETVSGSVDKTSVTLTVNPNIPDQHANQLIRVPSYLFQPYYPSPPTSFKGDKGERSFIAYLDVWQRIVTALEDPNLADVALGGADTDVRSQNVWQVKVARATSAEPAQALADWTTLLQNNTTPRGRLLARRQTPSAAPVKNQLYRVEIQSGNLPPVLNPIGAETARLGDSGPDQIVVANSEPNGVAWASGQTVRLIGTPAPERSDGAADTDPTEAPPDPPSPPISIVARVLVVTENDPDKDHITLTLDQNLPPGHSTAWTVQRLVTPQDVTPGDSASSQVAVGEPLDGVPWDGGQTVLLLGAPPSGGPSTTTQVAQILEVGPGKSDDQFTLTLDVSVSAGGLNWTLQRVPAFKWARDNASVASQVVAVTSTQITVQDFGSRSMGSFSGCQWVELTTTDRELQGRSGLMLPVTHAQGDTLTFASLPSGIDTTWIVRRWESGYITFGAPGGSTNGPPSAGVYAELEDGIQVALDQSGIYSTGDYWLIPARANTQAIEWPADSQGPLPQPPFGITHTYLPLRLILLDNGVWKATPPWPEADLRPHLGDLVNFLDKRGDTMTGTLRVAPANASDPALTTTGVVYVQSPTVDPPMPWWWSPDPDDKVLVPPPELVVNGGLLLWTNGYAPGSAIIAQPPTVDGSAGPRLRFYSQNQSSGGLNAPPASIEFHTLAPGNVNDLPDGMISLVNTQNFELQISGPSSKPGSNKTFTVRVMGNLIVDGLITVNGKDNNNNSATIAGTANISGTTIPTKSTVAPVRMATAPAGTNAADADRVDDAAVAEAVEIPEAVDLLSRMVEAQATQIAQLNTALDALTERVRALESP